ncbi:ATP-dependent DNA helicase [Subtercola boreus]|uniref:DNA 3'-5' helicase n=1 Tax=Subtercola boreus TaxID=120213 RepID=A0A3E0VJ66_9MICO|nr:ATP-dependent DNA helicase [Subtercola boreus]RFA09699.1 ATP-dependent DNA helicase [Subtercola boreus]TQL53206.1 DNA helicase-2/ATP-dependent DNA helicase PcrA [Subtercola boreus]
MISSLEIADALHLPPPTPQQQAVIESPLAPSIVIAGAGSGKTETMANRVVWLLANDLVSVSGILGLTFTRKAAGELAQRIRSRIDQLQAARLTTTEFDPFDSATVATYNSFANSIFRDNALLVGREGDSSILSEASAWQIARRLVANSVDDRLVGLDKSIDSITEAVISLSRAMSENVVTSNDVVRMAGQFTGLAELPTGSKRVPTLNAELRTALQAVSALPVLVDLADRFAEEKIRRGFVEYSDQVALALSIAERVPRVVADYRERFRVVLLDEYQDTSVVQTRLLSTLFAGRPVMAVGDPHQSIYGWRGASAANLGTFAVDFTGDRSGALAFPLSTSWRNPVRVLEAANRLVAPLTAASTVPVSRLEPRPAAGQGGLDVFFGETIDDEARAIANWFATQLERPAPKGGVRSAALLCRSIKKIGAFTTALTERGVRFHVLGLGGLLEEPAVADLVSALRVIYHPTAESELVRLLTGARWQVGLRDIAGLSSVAAWLADRDHHHARLDPALKQRIRDSVVIDEGRSLVDALDFVAGAPAGHRMLENFSPAGEGRLRAAGRQLAFLRTRTGLDLLDLVNLVTQELLLDVEVAANESSHLGRASLDAFSEQIAGFVAADPSAGLGAFLSWLREAEKRDRLSPRSDEPEPGTVQILTIHGSKGLEWDIVGVPRMVEDELPGKPQSKQGWLAFGELPFEFRGDSRELPVLAWRSAATQAEFVSAKASFTEQIVDRYAEEQRRLVYVAVTRARESLLLSGSFWVATTKPRGPGLFLRELAEAGLVATDALPEVPQSDVNPLAESTMLIPWPLAPLGNRRARVTAAAEAVAVADASAETPWSHDIDLLLAERAAALDGELLVVPTRVAASRFKDYVTEPDAVLRQLRRPMPERPYRQTRLGTRFHSWVENRYGLVGGSEQLDAAQGELDLDIDPGSGPDFDLDLLDPLDIDGGTAEEQELERLQATFEASPWGGRSPEEVEIEIHLVLGSNIVVCKIDAVFRDGDRYQIVDWKTGRAPSDAADLEVKQLQLALYRLAYSQYRGIDPGDIDAVFFFVSVDEIVTPDRMYSEPELLELWESVSRRR